MVCNPIAKATRPSLNETQKPIMTQPTADAVVIGGGVIGTSIAMHLAIRNAGKVTLIERGHLAGGPTGLSGAMIREHYLHPVLVRMAMESSAVFRNFADAVGGDAGFRRTGRLLLFPEHDLAAVLANVEMNRSLGVNIEMLTPAEAVQMVPQMDTSGIAVCAYEPEAGYADPVATTYAYADRARDHGAQVLTRTEVRGLTVSGGRITGVETTSGAIATPTVVVAAGSRSNQLAAQVGESLPVVPHRVQMAHFRRPPALESLRTIVIDHATGAYFREDSGLDTLAGGEGPGDLTEVRDPDSVPLNADHDMILSLWQRARMRFPDFDAATCRGGYSAIYDMTPDANPIIDSSRNVSGLYCAAGFSGHGFKLSPVVGRMAAELVLDGSSPDHPVEIFRASRFEEGEPLVAQHPYQGATHQ